MILSLEDIDAFERPYGSASNPIERLACERQLEEAREARRNHLERLHNLNAWQFHSVVKDLIRQEDYEIKDAARSRVMSGDRMIAMGVSAIPCIFDKGSLLIAHCRDGQKNSERTCQSSSLRLPRSSRSTLLYDSSLS